MDYLEYFQLTAEPFANAPLSQFYYASQQHADALNRLYYAAKGMKGLAVLVGDIGHGKTMLARHLLEALPEEEFEAALLVIVHADITSDWLLRGIAVQLGVQDPANDKLAVLSQLYARLLEITQAGRKAVVIIDEAQMLQTQELMEEFRGLLNLEAADRKLITFILVGLPELETHLRLDRPLAQRIAVRYRLGAFGLDDALAYIQHRLAISGAQYQPFSMDALQAVYDYTDGVPRLINTLCDNVLLELFLRGQQIADATLVGEIAANLGMGRPEIDPPIPATRSGNALPAGLAVESMAQAVAAEPLFRDAREVAKVQAPADTANDYSSEPVLEDLLSPMLHFPAAQPASVDDMNPEATRVLPPEQAPTTPMGRVRTTTGKFVDLGEIDAILADLKK